MSPYYMSKAYIANNNKLSSIMYRLVFKLHQSNPYILNGLHTSNQSLMSVDLVSFGMIRYI